MSYEASSRPGTPQASVPVDFSLPASSVSCLDSSAARHRIAVKANACAKRKPASRQMLDKRRDLREILLLRDTEEKLRMVTSIGEKKCQDLPGDQAKDSDHESFASEHEDEEVTDPSQCQKTSPTSSISAGDVSEGEEDVTAEEHVPNSEVPQSSWESPLTLELQEDDFLLDTGCEVVPEQQGSLLEEVLSSLKSPLASGLALEPENMVLQREVENITSEDMVAELKEENNQDLPDSSEPVVSTNEQTPLLDSRSESSVDSEDISEETTEEEELPEFTAEEASDTSHLQVPEEDDEKPVDKAESAKEDEELLESPNAFTVNVKETDDGHEDVAELERETRDSGDEESTVVELEKNEEFINEDELQEAGARSLETETDETSGEEKESAEVENVPESEDVWSLIESKDQPEASEPTHVELLLPDVSSEIESPVLNSPSSKSSSSSLEKEEEPEPRELDVSNEPQDVFEEKHEVVPEQQVLESPTRQHISSIEARPRFTIAPAWQRSLTSGGTQDQPQISLVPPETSDDSSSQTAELNSPVKDERPQPLRTQSSPTIPVPKELIHVQDEPTPENPFGVRLRKTPVLHRYVLDGESSWTGTQAESSGAQETPDQDQNSRKPVLPKKPDLLFDTAMPARKIPDTAGRISTDSTESPSWISVARQKQKNFKENSETSPEMLPSQAEVKNQDSPPSLSSPVSKEQLAQPCSPLQVFCSLEISNTSVVEKDSKRSVNPSASPLAQDEPPWLALAKKKAKAWSEMPQIVQ